MYSNLGLLNSRFLQCSKGSREEGRATVMHAEGQTGDSVACAWATEGLQELGFLLFMKHPAPLASCMKTTASLSPGKQSVKPSAAELCGQQTRAITLKHGFCGWAPEMTVRKSSWVGEKPCAMTILLEPVCFMLYIVRNCEFTWLAVKELEFSSYIHVECLVFSYGFFSTLKQGWFHESWPCKFLS